MEELHLTRKAPLGLKPSRAGKLATNPIGRKLFGPMNPKDDELQ